jgi:uncharacterized membrane protein YidH (DUF202 family)
MVTEVIIYRNPLEQAFWHSMMNGGAWIFLAVIALGVMYVAIFANLEKILRRHTKMPYWKVSKVCHWVSVVSVLVAAVGMHFYNIG